jgi:crotonobetainyl-CoA:carnitine CoA-transferase CaiB-like acyl-CoA transferase
MILNSMCEPAENRRRALSKGALSGVKVVEHAGFVAAPYCAKLLADLGAEVIKIENPTTGDDARRAGPFPGDNPDPESSGLFMYLNTNKMGITLNMRTETGCSIFRRLVETADILVEDNAPGTLDGLGIGYPAISELNPRLIVTSITPFGQYGPYADYRAHYLNTYHSGMLGYITPIGSARLDRPPLKVGGFLGEYACGLGAAVATLGALYCQRSTGHGQHIDVSKQEVLLSLGRLSAGARANGVPGATRAITLAGRGGMLRCRDGHVCVHVPEDRQWQGLVELMGCPEWAADEKYRTTAGRMLHLSEVLPRIEEWMETRTKEEVYHPAQKLRCTITPVMTSKDVVESGQSKYRGLFQGIDHPAAGRCMLPSSPYVFSKTPWKMRRPAPLERLGYGRGEMGKLTQAGII